MKLLDPKTFTRWQMHKPGLLLIMVLGLAACGRQAPPAPPGPGQPSLDVTGSWSGELVDEQGQSSPVSLQLVQTGTAVSATIMMDGQEVEGGGTIGEASLSLGFEAETHAITLMATVSVSSMQGTITVLSPEGTAAAAYDFTATRQ